MSAHTTPAPVPAQPQVEYRDVVGFPGYRVGGDGSAWSCWRNGGNDRTPMLTDSWRRLEGWVDKRRGKPSGYVKVGLMSAGKLHHFRLHRLILEAFVGPCPKGMECRHLDDDKSNNRLDNLCWGTPLENAQDKIKHHLCCRGAAVIHSRLTPEDIPVVRRMLAEGKSAKAVARWFRVGPNAIYNIANGVTWAWCEGG